MMRRVWLITLIAGVLAGCIGDSTRPILGIATLARFTERTGLPPARNQTAMTYDATRRNVVLFGGQAANLTGTHYTDLADTWLFNGNGWHEAHPRTHPAAREGASMSYDAQTKETVLIGGIERVNPARNDNVKTDTWTWDGERWHHEHPSHIPPAWPHVPISFDAATNALTILAPQAGSAASNAALGAFTNGGSFVRWTWDGHDWTEHHDADAPRLSFHGTLLRDPTTNGLLYFTYDPDTSCPPPVPGSPAKCDHPDPTGTYYSQTWTWNGSQWTHEQPNRAPNASAVAATDTRDRAVTVVSANQETWTWKHHNWAITARSVPAPSDAVAAFDNELDVLVVFGASNSPNLWLRRATTWRTVPPH